MAKFRQVHTSFWQDPYILELNPEEKYFYLYLMTNPKTTACGIYELSKKVIELETGLTKDMIETLFEKFENIGKIKYCVNSKEVFILNWLKYNDPKSPNTMKCIKKELQEIKNPEFVDEITQILEKINSPLQGAYKGLARTYKGATKPLPSKQIKIQEKEKETSSSRVDNIKHQTPLKVDISNKNDDDDFKNISETLTQWRVTDIEAIKKVYSISDIEKSIAMAKSYKPENPGAYFRCLLKNKASAELSTIDESKSKNGLKERCEFLKTFDSWNTEKQCEKPSREQIIQDLLCHGKEDEAKKLSELWHIKPKPT